MHCTTESLSIGSLWVRRNSINQSPEYQRESAIWSKDKQQLFLDSLFNNFDIPKIYFHDLRGAKGLYDFAVVDGKQRLHAIWNFLEDKMALAPDFQMAEPPRDVSPPLPDSRFSDLSEYWREAFKGIALPITLIQNAAEEDIEELFSRLNNGEPLNAAEKRNAMGGDMCKLIREVAKTDYFTKTLKVANRRFQHLEVAAKFLLIEQTQSGGGSFFCDLKKKYLDKMVDDNRQMTAAAVTGLQKRVEDQLKAHQKVFSSQDPLLNKQAYPPLYYFWIKRMKEEYGHPHLNTRLREFLEKFHANRILNLSKPEEDRDSVLIEFGRLMQQGTNDIGSLEQRTNILTRYFLQEYPDLAIKDKTRHFTDEERMAIWILGGKKCAECGKALSSPEDMEADHKRQWAHGGSTSLQNGRSLCGPCNKMLAEKIS